MKKKSIKQPTLTIKGTGLPTVQSSFYDGIDEANKRISKSINKNHIEEGNSIEKARAFVTNV